VDRVTLIRVSFPGKGKHPVSDQVSLPTKTRAILRAFEAKTTLTTGIPKSPSGGLGDSSRDPCLHCLLDARGDLRICSFQPSKLGSKHDENPYRRGARNGRAAASISENRDLTEEVAWPQLRQALAFRRDDCSSGGENEERIAGRTFANQALALHLALQVEPGRELPELVVVERVEERKRREIGDAGQDESTLARSVSCVELVTKLSLGRSKSGSGGTDVPRPVVSASEKR